MSSNLENTLPPAMPEGHEEYFNVESSTRAQEVCPFIGSIALESPELAAALINISTNEIEQSPPLRIDQVSAQAVEKPVSETHEQRTSESPQEPIPEKPSPVHVLEKAVEVDEAVPIVSSTSETLLQLDIETPVVVSEERSAPLAAEESRVDVEKPPIPEQKIPRDVIEYVEVSESEDLSAIEPPEEKPKDSVAIDVLDPVLFPLTDKAEDPIVEEAEVVRSFVEDIEDTKIPTKTLEKSLADATVEPFTQPAIEVIKPTEVVVSPESISTESPEETVKEVTSNEKIVHITPEINVAHILDNELETEELVSPENEEFSIYDPEDLHETALEDLSFDSSSLMPTVEEPAISTPVETDDQPMEATPTYTSMITELPDRVEKLDPEEQEKVHAVIEVLMEAADSDSESIDLLESAVDELCEILEVDLSDEEKAAFIKILLIAPQESIQSIINAQFADEPHDRGTHERLYKFTAFVQSLQDILQTHGLMGRLAIKSLQFN